MDIIRAAFIQHRQHLVNYVNRRVDDYDLAEDLVQDAFLRLLETNVGVRAESVERLLFSVCRNLVLDHLRRKWVAARINIYMCEEQPKGVDATEQAVLARELAEQEMRIVVSMPAKRQQVYRLSRYEGKGIDEIAGCMGVSHKTVEAHLFAGRKHVRERLGVLFSQPRFKENQAFAS